MGMDLSSMGTEKVREHFDRIRANMKPMEDKAGETVVDVLMLNPGAMKMSDFSVSSRSEWQVHLPPTFKSFLTLTDYH